MRYRLRTLLILAGVAPPLLAVGWFTAVWLWDVADIKNDSRTYVIYAGILTTLFLAVFSAVAPPPFSREPAKVPWGYLLLLWCCQFLVQGLWIWCVVGLLTWTDMPPRAGVEYYWIYETLASAYIASIVSARIALRSVANYYVKVVTTLTGLLASLIALFFIL